jgi:hypothetical protein
MTRAAPSPWYGQKVPEGVRAITVEYIYWDDQFVVRWLANGPETHDMPFEQTHEGVLAAITAMKLTC